MTTSTSTGRLATGAVVAGVWVVERVLTEIDGIEGALVRGQDSGRAMLFVLPPGAPDPALDEAEAARWGSARRILRDPEFGRVVVDDIPEGPLLADRVALGQAPSRALVDELQHTAREAHRRGAPHGQIALDRIVLGAEGVVVAGWGLDSEDAEQRLSHDQASLSRLSGLCASTGEATPSLTRLQAAIVSGHLPTLRSALEEWRRDGGAEDDPAARRATDALERVERKLRDSLAEARQRIAAGDALGALAPCREAIRLGAESEAGPILRQARRQARRLVGGRWRPSARMISVAAGCGLVLVLLLGAAWLALRPSDEALRLRELVRAAVQRDGERAGVMLLASQVEAGAARDALLAERLSKVLTAERRTLTGLRREAVTEGARPGEQDAEAEQALARLGDLAGGNVHDAALAGRLQSVFGQLDHAAAAYRAATKIAAADAEQAADSLMALDPVFRPAGATP